jgi:hypothetical protein
LRGRHAGRRHQHAGEKERRFYSHIGKTAKTGGGSAPASRDFQDLR